MATYETLSAEDQATLAEATKHLRAVSGQTAKQLTAASVVSSMFTVGADAVLAQLDPGAVVPNTSGLGGAQPLTKEEIEALVASARGALTLLDTQAQRDARVKAAGINAL